MVEHRPVACVPSGDVLRCLPLSGLQTRWAHTLEVYVPLARAYGRKHPMVHAPTKNHTQRVREPQHDRLQ